MFVYGTLKRGFPNHHLLPSATYLGEAASLEPYPLVVASQWFTPTLIAEPGQGLPVRGELYRTDGEGLAELDRLEGRGLSFGFDRSPIEVELASEIMGAWTYTKPRDRIEVIHGDPIAEYSLDPRYVRGEDRTAPNRGLGE